MPIASLSFPAARGADRGAPELDGTVQATLAVATSAERVLATLRAYEIPETPENYALWFEYYTGSNRILRKTIDTIISNRLPFDQDRLEDLHARMFAPARERKLLREMSLHLLGKLEELDRRPEEPGTGRRTAQVRGEGWGELTRTLADLKAGVRGLAELSLRISGRSEVFGGRIRASVDKIETLERDLERALRAANLDSLTGISNRRGFEAELRQRTGDAMNGGDDISLLMIDIDNFKQVNDQWGHPAGDEVLRRVAERLRATVRRQDVTARYGGEEFVILLPHTNLRQACVVAEKARAAIETARTETAPGQLPPPVTVSVGVAGYRLGDSLTGWIGRADAALYQAKRAGRNCVRAEAETRESAACGESNFAAKNIPQERKPR